MAIPPAAGHLALLIGSRGSNRYLCIARDVSNGMCGCGFQGYRVCLALRRAGARQRIKEPQMIARIVRLVVVVALIVTASAGCSSSTPGRRADSPRAAS